MSLGNGWAVIDVLAIEEPTLPGVTRTIYVRIPPDQATPIDGGCSCAYCKAHPELVPKWDALAVSDEWNGHTWTVHYPQVQARPRDGGPRKGGRG